jgi:hypoxanthine phosphoribosyltransferase
MAASATTPEDYLRMLDRGEEPSPNKTKLNHNINVEKFNRLYEENKEEILVTETYPINQDALIEWQQALQKSSVTLQRLGRLVAFGLQHISFQQFYDSLIQQARAQVAECQSSNGRIALFINGPINKSNFWAALLIWPIVKQYVVAIIDTETVGNWLKTLTLAEDETIRVLLVDDASFSGQQIEETLESAKIRRRSQKYLRKVYWVVLVGAISTTASATIKRELPWAIFPANSVLLRSMNEIADELFPTDKEEFFATMLKKEYKRIYQIQPDTHMAYFDHKLPDSISTISKIIAMAPAIDETTPERNISTRSLIQRCEPNQYKVEGRYYDLDDFVVEYDQYTICPPTFYKWISYEFDGEQLEDFQSVHELLQSI